jgi:ABC-type Zn2+ transport system substrate-binding protein/surface adhesin
MKLYQSILICATLSSTVSAQTAMQLFNPAAKEFIYGNTPVASNLVEQALTHYPDNEKLLKLKKLIEEQKQNQKQDQQKQKQDQQKQDQQQKDQNQKDKQQEQDKKDQADQQKDQQQPAQPKQAGEMSPEEAQQLLDAMKQDEQDQRANLKPYLGNPVRVEKDW